jgi:hypothetical protein
VKHHRIHHGILSATLLMGCGDKNVFAPLSPPTPAEKATAYMEKENPDAAIETLLNALGDTFRDLYTTTTNGINNEEALHAEMLDLIEANSVKKPYNLISILASAQAQKYNVDPFAMVLQLAKSKNSTSTTGLVDAASLSLGALTQLYPILPKATSANIKGIQGALFILRSIRSPYATKADYLKLGLFLTATLVLELKLIDTNEDGIISIDEATHLSEDAAFSFITTLESAVSSILQSDLNSSKSRSASDKIKNLQTTLQNQEGTTHAEKLRNFFAQAQANR